jgi:hypothetical protein
MFTDRPTKMVAVPIVVCKKTNRQTKGGHMAVATLKVGTKMVEKELDKDETDAFYDNYTFKRRHTKKFDQEKRKVALASSTRVKKNMAREHKHILAEKAEIHGLANELSHITKNHVMMKNQSFNIDKELARGIYMGGNISGY